MKLALLFIIHLDLRCIFRIINTNITSLSIKKYNFDSILF